MIKLIIRKSLFIPFFLFSQYILRIKYSQNIALKYVIEDNIKYINIKLYFLIEYSKIKLLYRQGPLTLYICIL